MGANERRNEIIEVLSRRRHETMKNIATKFCQRFSTSISDNEAFYAVLILPGVAPNTSKMWMGVL